MTEEIDEKAIASLPSDVFHLLTSYGFQHIPRPWAKIYAQEGLTQEDVDWMTKSGEYSDEFIYQHLKNPLVKLLVNQKRGGVFSTETIENSSTINFIRGRNIRVNIHADIVVDLVFKVRAENLTKDKIEAFSLRFSGRPAFTCSDREEFLVYPHKDEENVFWVGCTKFSYPIPLIAMQFTDTHFGVTFNDNDVDIIGWRGGYVFLKSEQRRYLARMGSKKHKMWFNLGTDLLSISTAVVGPLPCDDDGDHKHFFHDIGMSDYSPEI